MRPDREREIGSTGFAPGWTEGVDMVDYLTDTAVSASMLWTLHEHTAAHVLHEIRHPRASTPATELGDLVHVAVWEPDEFEDRYVAIGQCEATKKGDGLRCTNQGSVYRDGQSYCGTKGHDPYAGEPMPDDVSVVAAPEKAKALGMTAALLSHPTARELIEAPGPREVVGVAQDPRTGLWLRIRPDHLIETDARPLFCWSEVNLKSTALGAGPGRFSRTSEKLGYYFRAAFYRLVLRELWPVEPQNFFYPVVESDGSFQVIVYRLNDDALDIGEAEVRGALNTLADCVESGRWPGYGPAIHDLRLSEWRHKQAHSIDFIEV